jgi:Restriction endonuclease BglII
VLAKLNTQGFEIQFESHAAAILEKDFPDALSDIEKVLKAVRIPILEIIGSGGGETKATQRLRRAFDNLEWHKKHFEIKKIINGVERESISHEVDHAKTFANQKIVALEIEWNNKDPFFDRDLENFKRLHAEGAISAGVIVTRGSSLHSSMRDFVAKFAELEKIASFQDLERIGLNPTRRQRKEITEKVERTRKPLPFSAAWTDSFVSDKYGEATTHWRKLIARIARGVGNPCPLLLIGLPSSIVQFDATK